MDLTKAFTDEAADDNEPVEVPVFDRDGEPYTDADGNPAVFFVLGEYSDKLKKFERKRTNRNLRGQAALDATALAKQMAEREAAATVDWRIAIGGEVVPFSFENAVTVFTAAPWLGQQVERAIVAHSSFFAKK